VATRVHEIGGCTRKNKKKQKKEKHSQQKSGEKKIGKPNC
jgi:hypothetical protein